MLGLAARSDGGVHNVQDSGSGACGAVRVADYSRLLFCPGDIPRVPPDARKTLRSAITAADFEYLLGEQPSKRAAGPDELTFEMLHAAPDSMKQTIRTCINSTLIEEAPPPQSWMVGADLLPSEEGHSGCP